MFSKLYKLHGHAACMPIIYHCPFLVLHNGLDVPCVKPMAHGILNVPDVAENLLSCNVHDEMSRCGVRVGLDGGWNDENQPSRVLVDYAIDTNKSI